RVEQTVLPRIPGGRRQGRPLALDPRRGEEPQLPGTRAPRLRRELTCARTQSQWVECRVHLLATALGLSLVGSCGGLFVASSLVLFPAHVRTRLVPWLVSYAVGALLGVALLALLPEALGELPPQAVFGTLLF